MARRHDAIRRSGEAAKVDESHPLRHPPSLALRRGSFLGRQRGMARRHEAIRRSGEAAKVDEPHPLRHPPSLALRRESFLERQGGMARRHEAIRRSGEAAKVDESHPLHHPPSLALRRESFLGRQGGMARRHEAICRSGEAAKVDEPPSPPSALACPPARVFPRAPGRASKPRSRRPTPRLSFAERSLRAHLCATRCAQARLRPGRPFALARPPAITTKWRRRAGSALTRQSSKRPGEEVRRPPGGGLAQP